MGKSFQFKNCGNGKEQSMKKCIFILIITFCCTCFFVGPSLSNEKNIFEPVTVRASISAPTLTVTTVDTKVSFSWTSVSGATGYTLYYAPYPDVTSIGSIDMGNKTNLSTTLSVGNAFYIAIQAYSNNGNSEYSNICYFILTSDYDDFPHKKAWKNAAEKSVTDNYYKYSIYSSRSLMVKHPEIYLQADALWMEEIISVYTGWQNNYEARDRLLTFDEWYDAIGSKLKEGFRNETKYDGTQFQWSKFQWENHRANVINHQDIYDAECPYQSWLDLRLPFVWASMRGTGWKMPYLSLAEAFYFEMRSLGSSPYLLISNNGKGYVATSSTLYDPLTGLEINSSQIDGTIVLVMDQDSVWYPLMNRDDTSSDISLNSVVNQYCTNGNKPTLSYFEQASLSNLLIGTKLVNIQEKWAIMFAGRAVNERSWFPKPMREYFGDLFPERYKENPNFNGNPREAQTLGAVITEMGNRLSPAAALLASLAKKESDNLVNALSAISDKYLEWFKNENSSSTWYGSYFRGWLPNLESKLISKIGNCFTEACNVGAALVLVNNKDWDIYLPNWDSLDRNGGHIIAGVYTNGEGRTLNNGLYNTNDSQCTNGPLWNYKPYRNIAFSLVYRPNVGYITTGSQYFSPFTTPFTNLSYQETVDMVNQIKLHESDFVFVTGTYSYSDKQPKTVDEYLNYIYDFQNQWKSFNWGN
jgi:hypothetical protein